MVSLFNMVKGKNSYKAGKFGSESKIYGKAAISAKDFSTDSYSKKGKFNIIEKKSKNKDFKKRDKKIPLINNISDSELGILASSKTLPVEQILNIKSPTGVFSASKVYKKLETFGKKLKGKSGIEDVKLKKQGNKFKSLELTGEYRKKELKFDPRNMVLSNTGWKADIPENFIKTEQGYYKAPEKKYEEYYESETNDDTERRYKKYIPAQIYVTDDGKLKKIVKKDVYMEKYSKKYDDDYRKKEKERDVFNKKTEEFFGTGVLKSQRLYDIYEREEKERERGDKETEVSEYEPYLKSEKVFAPKGLLKTEKLYSPYKTKYYREKDYNDKTKEMKKDIFLKSEKKYGDYGRLKSQRDYDDYTSVYEKKYDDNGKERDKRYETYLKQEKIYGGPESKLITQKDYDLFATDEKYVDYGSRSVYKDKFKPFMKKRTEFDYSGQKIYEEDYSKIKSPDMVIGEPVEIRKQKRENIEKDYFDTLKQEQSQIKKSREEQRYDIPVRYWGKTTPQFGTVSEYGRNVYNDTMSERDMKKLAEKTAKQTFNKSKSSEKIVYGGENYGLKGVGYYSPEKKEYIYERYF